VEIDVPTIRLPILLVSRRSNAVWRRAEEAGKIWTAAAAYEIKNGFPVRVRCPISACLA
jgi:hypothetical protein